MYIAPNTSIFIMKNVPLDNTYQHTILFRTVSAQLAFIRAYQQVRLDAQSYQRVNENTIRVDVPLANISMCNYLSFFNRSIGGDSKYYFAFINDLRYINNNVTEIVYEIDVIQTWLLYCDINPCLIEREHSLTDVPGENVIKENFDLGDSFVHKRLDVELTESGAVTVADDVDLTPLTVSVLTASPQTGNFTAVFKVPTTINYGIYSKLYLYQWDLADPTETADLIAFMSAVDSNAILAMTQCPDGWWQYSGIDINSDGIEQIVKKCEVAKPYNGPISGYTPKNKKLYTYPYCFLRLSNNQGEYTDLSYENFGDAVNAEFDIFGTILPMVAFTCVPVNYAGIGAAREMWDFAVSLKNFPVCCYSNDVFKNWWAENQNSFLTSAITGTIGAATSGAMFAGGAGAVMGAGSGLASMAAGTMSKISDMRNVPNTASNISTSYVVSAASRYRYSFYNISLKAEILKTIDDYFDMFGYASHKLKKPYRNARPHWSYVKTNGCTIKYTAQNTCIPQADAEKIRRIYDSGITFWNSASEVGNYSLDNSPYAQVPSNPY